MHQPISLEVCYDTVGAATVVVVVAAVFADAVVAITSRWMFGPIGFLHFRMSIFNITWQFQRNKSGLTAASSTSPP